MKEKEVEDRLHFLEKQVNALEDGIENGKLSFKGEIDEIKIELESIKSCLKEIHPDFKKRFSETKKKITLEKNPEWISDDE
jgi:hypothetical protein